MNKRSAALFYCLLVLACFCPSIQWAQQETIFSLYRHHLNIQNPAAVGLAQSSAINLSTRIQWLGVEDAPETQAITFFAPSKKSRLHTGFSVFNDKTFVERQTQFAIDFSYALPLGGEKKIYLGLKAGVSTIVLNAANLMTYGSTGSDPNLLNRSGAVPNLGVGFHYQSSRFYFAASVPHLLNTERFSMENNRVSLATDRPHIYLNTAYRFSLTKEWEFVPTLLWTAVEGAPSSTQVDFLMNYQNQLEIGPLFNLHNGIGASLGIRIASAYQLVYAYTGQRGNQPSGFAKGSHEIALKISLDTASTPAPNRIQNPLFSSPKERDVKEDPRPLEGKDTNKFSTNKAND